VDYSTHCMVVSAIASHGIAPAIRERTKLPMTQSLSNV
jgi:hypothetical protein